MNAPDGDILLRVQNAAAKMVRGPYYLRRFRAIIGSDAISHLISITTGAVADPVEMAKLIQKMAKLIQKVIRRTALPVPEVSAKTPQGSPGLPFTTRIQFLKQSAPCLG